MDSDQCRCVKPESTYGGGVKCPSRRPPTNHKLNVTDNSPYRMNHLHEGPIPGAPFTMFPIQCTSITLCFFYSHYCTWTKQEFMEVETKYVYMYIMWALQYIHDNLSKWHIDCWVLHTELYPSVGIEEDNPSYTRTWEQVKWRSMSKQNRRWTSTSCWHCNACMIIYLKGIAFAGHCTQSGTHQWGSTKKFQVRSRSKQNRRCTSTSFW